ncbi:hypothetical protein HZY97_18800 [Sphingomonas sp. R-74633]|uniref:hypothetical protein n=1 Tax=Sphingomonas sp. R-74633 TaxID=2751188 RepID=UPI0015D362BB|nr:hypothetical protein [Sphingomonas sp. R-74633]NYT42830.1 hypothetical protein [Sphingomonas sp. R-74633]
MNDDMLTELHEAHATLLAGIQELEDATRAPAPDPSALAAIRWRLSRASSRRRRLVEQACTRLAADAPRSAPQLDVLRDSNTDMLSATSRHVGAWTIERVVADWPGYRAASIEMRKAMRARIATEKSILYPLLEKAEDRATS